MRDLLVRGMLVGIVAGLLAFGFARLFGEPQVGRAVAFEEQHHAAAHAMSGMAPDEPELVSRGVQANLGLLVGTVVYGAAFGGLFALVFAFAYGRVDAQDPRLLAGLLALAGFFTIVFVPQLKYPANPPAVGEADTISYRTGLFLLMLAVSLIAAGIALRVRQAFAPTHGAWTAGLAGAGVFVALTGAAMLLLPSINEVPDAFPAGLLWRFRLMALGTQFVMWTAIGLLFGAAARRRLAIRAA